MATWNDPDTAAKKLFFIVLSGVVAFGTIVIVFILH